MENLKLISSVFKVEKNSNKIIRSFFSAFLWNFPAVANFNDFRIANWFFLPTLSLIFWIIFEFNFSLRNCWRFSWFWMRRKVKLEEKKLLWSIDDLEVIDGFKVGTWWRGRQSFANFSLEKIWTKTNKTRIFTVQLLFRF